LEAVRLRLTDAEKGLTKSKAEADILRTQAATGSVNRDEDQVTHRLMERMTSYRSRSGFKAVEREKHRRDGVSQRGMKWVFQLDCHPAPNLMTTLEGWSSF